MSHFGKTPTKKTFKRKPNVANNNKKKHSMSHFKKKKIMMKISLSACKYEIYCNNTQQFKNKFCIAFLLKCPIPPEQNRTKKNRTELNSLHDFLQILFLLLLTCLQPHPKMIRHFCV
jgi:hypothetical protein